MKRSCVIVC